MVWWQVLELAEQADDPTIPQLLIKSTSSSNAYVVHLTDLTNIWSEKLDLDGIVERASQVQSPIEVSKQDTTQLGILLDNVSRSLSNSGETSCHITRNDRGGLVLTAVISLPKPLESLTWKFYLEKTTAAALKTEFILPLLVSSHIQLERITSLVAMIGDRDRAIGRLADQYESNNLDLAAAFPVLGGLKSGRRIIKREQAAKHITALQPFHEASWRKDTGKLEDSHITTLGLFQEALAQNDSKVPLELKSENEGLEWWTNLPDRLSSTRAAAKSKLMKLPVARAQEEAVESSGDETEDEFETHDNFKTRGISKPAIVPAPPSPLSGRNERDNNAEDEGGEDSEDLDAPPKNNSFAKVRTASERPVVSETSRSVSPQIQATTEPAPKLKNKGFKIGGKAKQALPKSSSTLQDEGNASEETLKSIDTRAHSPPAKRDAPDNANVQKSRRPFKIGGKNKRTQDTNESEPEVSTPMQSAADATYIASSQHIKEETTAVEAKEETAEEKAERKRAELKRKNDEAARKQTQQKKKKRF